jgi:hypothetical protein
VFLACYRQIPSIEPMHTLGMGKLGGRTTGLMVSAYCPCQVYRCSTPGGSSETEVFLWKLRYISEAAVQLWQQNPRVQHSQYQSPPLDTNTSPFHSPPVLKSWYQHPTQCYSPLSLPVFQADVSPLLYYTYGGVSKCFRTGHLERDLQMIQFSATRCSYVAILWVSVVSFASITLCVASQLVFIVVSVYFVIDKVRKLLDTPSYSPSCPHGQPIIASYISLSERL